MDILGQWELSRDELNEILTENPSLRGILLGYVAERKLRKMWFSDKRISDLIKYDDHDRTRKGDLSFQFGGAEVNRCGHQRLLQPGHFRVSGRDAPELSGAAPRHSSGGLDSATYIWP